MIRNLAERTDHGKTMDRFVQAQLINTQRDAVTLRPFALDEFGKDATSPSAAHIQAANQLISRLRQQLQRSVGQMNENAIIDDGDSEQVTSLLAHKQRSIDEIKQVERIWDYYLELFGQRQSRFAKMLLGLDRMGLDCYQAIYTGLGTNRSIPSPTPFSYMETGFTPSTFRRGVKMSKLGRNQNPFPIVQLPYHRMVNPWTLGAVHHEVAHNIQSDLGLWHVVPKQILHRLQQAGIPPKVAKTWARWHKEIWADLCGTLLGGPGIVASLLDVLARTPAATLRYNPSGVHPTPYLRALTNTELLHRMGFEQEAGKYEHLWRKLYPQAGSGNLPPMLLDTFPKANEMVVQIICYQPYPQLGDKSLAEVSTFNQNHAAMTQEAAQRIAKGVDVGVVPARFLVGAARLALDQRLTSPSEITKNFYRALYKR